ncbi:MAG: tRNA (adenosine(37)-N6)-threonylcarbamoyltransferase complex dimerization subunit type 1 TsaB [Akkermansiaceae bacterium]
MQTILAIETSVPQASLCLSLDGEIALDVTFTSERGHNTTIFEPLADALKLAKGQLDQIIVGTGPGSYSGTRIGIAAAQGVAIAQDCAICGVGSIAGTSQALQYRHQALAVGDARRGLFYTIAIDEAGLPTAPELMDEAAFKQKLSTESHAHLMSLDDVEKLRNTASLIDSVAISSAEPSARGLLAAWHEFPKSAREDLHKAPLMPTYLRAPFTSKAKSGHPLLR